jgi:hypothetical protein
MAQRGKAKAVQRNPKVSICVLDEMWPPTYLQVYCDARIDATMESDPERVIDSMMRLYEVMGRRADAGVGAGERGNPKARINHAARRSRTWSWRTWVAGL